MLKTPITELFGIERPIVQGGLMWIARAELAAGVGNAGGIGFMTALTFPDAEALLRLANIWPRFQAGDDLCQGG